ncbi:MAG: hypothetical protein WDW36_001084 [Sanguina aurantia]
MPSDTSDVLDCPHIRDLLTAQVSPLVAHDNDWGGGFESDSERVALNTLRLAASQSEIHSNELSTSDSPPHDGASAESDQWRPDMPKGVFTPHPQAAPAPSDNHPPSSRPTQSVTVAAAVVPLQSVKEDLQQQDGVAGPNTQPGQSGAARGSGSGQGAGNGAAAGAIISEGGDGQQGSPDHSDGQGLRRVCISLPAYTLRAGPRHTVYFDGRKVNAAIVVTGRICPGTNDVVQGIVHRLVNYGVAATSILGVMHGLQGLTNRGCKPKILTPRDVEGIHLKGGQHSGHVPLALPPFLAVHGPASDQHRPRPGVFTSLDGALEPPHRRPVSRYPPWEEARNQPVCIPKVVDRLALWEVDMLFVVGGRGGFHSAEAIKRELAARKHPCVVVAIPKSIENGFLLLDKSFGFDSAVQESQRSLLAAKVVASSCLNGLSIVTLSGRNSGFLVMQASLASGVVDVCLVPEVPFSLEKLKHHIKAVLDRQGHAVVCVADGAGQALMARMAAQAEAAAAAGREVETGWAGPGGDSLRGDSLRGDAPGGAGQGAQGGDSSGVDRGESRLHGTVDKGAAHGQRGLGLFLEHHLSRTLTPHTFHIDPTVSICTVQSDSRDHIYSKNLASSAVDAAFAGFTGVAVSTINTRYALTPIPVITQAARTIDPRGKAWNRLRTAIGQPVLI